jgi:hypothetical protein
MTTEILRNMLYQRYVLFYTVMVKYFDPTNRWCMEQCYFNLVQLGVTDWYRCIDICSKKTRFYFKPVPVPVPISTILYVGRMIIALFSFYKFISITMFKFKSRLSCQQWFVDLNFFYLEIWFVYRKSIILFLMQLWPMYFFCYFNLSFELSI